MTNALDIYIWSIEDQHSVRAEIAGINAYLTFAAFTDKIVACNFRDWILATIPPAAIVEMIRCGYSETPISEGARQWGELIAARRVHPAADKAYYERIDSQI